LPDGLVELLVRDGLWTSGQAVRYVEAADPGERPGALAQLFEVLPADDRETLLRLALRDIPLIAEPENRLVALSALARLPGTGVDTVVLDSLLALARAAAACMPSDRRSLALLRAVGRQLSEPDLVSEALDAVRTTTVASDMVFAAVALAGFCSPDQRSALLADALRAARPVTDEWDRVHLLTALGPVLAPDALAEAIRAAEALTDRDLRVWGTADLAGHLDPTHRAAAMDRIWPDADTVTDAEYRADTYQILAKWLDDERRVVARHRWLAAVAAIDGDQRGWTLAGLAVHLVPEQHTEAVRIAGTVTDDRLRALVLSELARYMAPADRRASLQEALRAVARCEASAAG
jgi:uncharacterized protein YjeT (DUF2065 family)